MYARVYRLQVGISYLILAYAVQYADKGGIALPVDLAQLNAHQLHLLPHLGVEEVSRGVEGLHEPPLVP